MMRSLAILTCLFLLLSGCDGQSEQQLREAEVQKSKLAEEYAQRKARRERERQLMRKPDEAIPELERRLGEWLAMTNGVLLIKTGKGRSFTLHAMSAKTPWVVSCNRAGLAVSVGSWAEVWVSEGSGGSEERFSKLLTRAMLSREECAPLLLAMGQKMSRITNASPER